MTSLRSTQQTRDIRTASRNLRQGLRALPSLQSRVARRYRQEVSQASHVAFSGSLENRAGCFDAFLLSDLIRNLSAFHSQVFPAML